ncbi:MAG: hypothetical protein IT303_12250 [Dehalococcoidia bacterium]|nr:hypothetical protein [Dehalococcoidia bacterium]
MYQVKFTPRTGTPVVAVLGVLPKIGDVVRYRDPSGERVVVRVEDVNWDATTPGPGPVELTTSANLATGGDTPETTVDVRDDAVISPGGHSVRE